MTIKVAVTASKENGVRVTKLDVDGNEIEIRDLPPMEYWEGTPSGVFHLWGEDQLLIKELPSV